MNKYALFTIAASALVGLAKSKSGNKNIQARIGNRGFVTRYGKKINLVRQLGHGEHSTVWLGDNGMCYIGVRIDSPDISKDLLAEYVSTHRTNHLPELEYLGNNEHYRIFESPVYNMPLGIQPEWEDYINLDDYRFDIQDEDDEHYYKAYDAGLWDIYGKDHQTTAAESELKEFQEWALQTHGDKIKSISQDLLMRNLGTDENGTLILVDPLWISKK